MFPVLVVAVAQAAPVPPPESVADDVVVVGSRRSFKLNTRALRAAQSAFLNHRGRYAPHASLSFLVGGRDGGPLPVKRVRLYFTDGRSRIAVPIGADNSFDLAGLPSGNWWLESNLSRRDVRIQPLTLSPRSSRYDYRLGDGRLQCRVSWAMLKANVSLLATPLIGAADAVGPCTSRKIGIYLTTHASIRTAFLAENARSVPIEVGMRRHTYRFPGEDPTFGDEARVTITIDRVGRE